MRQQVPRWEHFSHGADIGIRGIGRSREEAFEFIGLALSAVQSKIDLIELNLTVPITQSLEAPDDELLLFAWLNAIVYQTSITGMIFGKYMIESRADGLWGWAQGEPIDETRHDIACEVKGATMTSIKALKLSDGTYLAQCVVDV